MMKPSGVITITTDFGHQGPFVGVMKGVILSRLGRCAHRRSHARDPRALAGRGRLLAGARLPLFSPGHRAHRGGGPGRRHLTRHHRRDRRRALVPRAGQRAARADRRPPPGCHRSCGSRLRGSRSSAFTARAPHFMVGTSSRRSPRSWRRGAACPRTWASASDSVVPAWVDEPSVEHASVSGVVITVDHFGNLITNIDGDTDRAFRRARACMRATMLSRCCGLMGTSSLANTWRW